MTNIVLICAAGMSTSLMVNKMKDAAKADNFDCEIKAYAQTKTNEAVVGADIILLGPQVRFLLSKIKAQVSCPVEPIEMRAYGQMDGAAVLAQARKVLGV